MEGMGFEHMIASQRLGLKPNESSSQFDHDFFIELLITINKRRGSALIAFYWSFDPTLIAIIRANQIVTNENLSLFSKPLI